MSQLQMMTTPARDMFHIKLDGYTLSIKRDPAKYLHDVLENQHALCKKSRYASFTTVLRSDERIITIEMSKTNGLLFTVTWKSETIQDVDVYQKTIGYVQWSDMQHWINDFYDGLLLP